MFSADKFGRINFENFRDLISVNYAALATFDTIVNRIVEAESAFESEWSEGLYTDKYFVSVRRMHEKLKVHILLNSDESDTILEIYFPLFLNKKLGIRPRVHMAMYDSVVKYWNPRLISLFRDGIDYKRINESLPLDLLNVIYRIDGRTEGEDWTELLPKKYWKAIRQKKKRKRRRSK